MIKTDLESCWKIFRTLQDQGFYLRFYFKDGKIYPDKAPYEISYGAGEFELLDAFVFEGSPEPVDDLVLYVIQTADGLRGLVQNGLRAYANPDIDQLMVHTWLTGA